MMMISDQWAHVHFATPVHTSFQFVQIDDEQNNHPSVFHLLCIHVGDDVSVDWAMHYIVNEGEKGGVICTII